MAAKNNWGYFAFSEAANELSISEADLTRHIAVGNIVPSMFFSGRYEHCSIEGHYSDGRPDFNHLCDLNIKGSYYLQGHRQTAPSSCTWEWFSEYQDVEKNGHPFYAIGSELNSLHVKDDLIFMPEELARFRQKFYSEKEAPGLTNEDNREDRAVPEKRRNSERKLLIGMAMRGYNYDPKASRQNAVSDIHADLSLLGIKIDEQTIRSILKDAVQVLPGKAAK